MCVLWHVEFLNEQECVHKSLSSPLHLGTLHDVFVQMISLARRQPNYLSSSVSGEPKRTSTLIHTRRPVHIPQGCLSATLLPHCVMEAITLPLSVLAMLSLGRLILFLVCGSCLEHHPKMLDDHLDVTAFHGLVRSKKKKKSRPAFMCFMLS